MEERRRLLEHYREMGEGELLELAANFNDLTPMAQDALREEMRTRELGTPESVMEPPADASRGVPEPSDRPAEVHWESHHRWSGPGDAGEAESPEEAAPVEYTWKVPLADMETTTEAWQLAQALRRAGIESWIDRGVSRVLVAADQLDRARAVAEQPIPQEIIDESKAEVPEFEIPVCPGCGAPDPTLESVDPVNCWHCESCDKEWSEAADLEQ
jgi:hypothetical protein